VTGPVTARFVYVRRHGPTGRFRGRYPDALLRADARRARAWAREGLDVYVYFNNDVGGHAVRDASRLVTLLQRPVRDPRPAAKSPPRQRL
jgi:uncharacterized protein YecE (DUF72 family)